MERVSAVYEYLVVGEDNCYNMTNCYLTGSSNHISHILNFMAEDGWEFHSEYGDLGLATPGINSRRCGLIFRRKKWSE